MVLYTVTGMMDEQIVHGMFCIVYNLYCICSVNMVELTVKLVKHPKAAAIQKLLTLNQWCIRDDFTCRRSVYTDQP